MKKAPGAVVSLIVGGRSRGAYKQVSAYEYIIIFANCQYIIIPLRQRRCSATLTPRSPVHRIDSTGALSDLSAVGDAQWNQTWRQNFPKKKSPEDKKKERAESLSTAYEACSINGAVTLKDLAEYMGVTEKTVKRYTNESDDFWLTNGVVGRKD